MTNTRNAQRRQRVRRGSAVVEFAVCAPVLFLFVFAGIEFARANMLRNTVENAAYEGARRGIVPGATATQCEASAQDMLDLLGISGATITVTPTTIQPTTQEVTVAVSVPMSQANLYLAPQFFQGGTFDASVTLPRETE